jgi:hypothetical protein
MQALQRIVRIIAWQLRALGAYIATRAFPQPTPAWWQRHPRLRSRRRPRPPTAQESPQLTEGTLVRLRGKPDRQRRVLQSTWHWHRHEYVYIVETSARPPFKPYWFFDQLSVEARDAAQGAHLPERS